MFTIESAGRDLRRLPLLVKGGIGGMVVAGLADVTAHLEASGHAGHLHEHTSAEASAHLLGFVSMVVVYLGVVIDGLRRSRARR
jgi:hypothetical protein